MSNLETVTSSTANEPSSKAKVTETSKICVVCGDKSTGTHFGAITCEGCKGFFRRSVKKNANFKCSLDGNCKINKENRKHCQACRFKACLIAGMQSSLVLSDEEVNKKRDLIKHNREKRIEQQRIKRNEQEQQRLKMLANIGSSDEDIRMTMEEKLLIECLLKSHEESYDFSYKEYDTFRGKEKIATPDQKSNSIQSSLAWLVASMSKTEDIEAQYASMNKQAIPNLGKTMVAEPTVTAETSTSSSVVTPQESGADHSDVFSSLHGTTETTRADTDNEPSTSKEVEESNKSSEENNEKSSIEQLTENDLQNTSEGLQIPEDVDSLSLRDFLRSRGFSMSMVEDSNSKQLLQHFCDIMTWGIKTVIDFCKNIPEFCALSLVDQIVLLRGGCLEMLVLRSYFAFSSNENKYLSEKFQYQPGDFLQAGASKEFVNKYNSLHIRMRKMKLQVEEICLILALVLFSPDRLGLEDQAEVEKMQDKVARTLKAYEYTHRPPRQARTMYCELLLILPVLRTINMLFASNIMSLQASNESDMNPLILEINSSANDEDDT